MIIVWSARKQKSNPVLSDDVEGYQCITCAYASQSWSGLKFKNEHALLTGSGGSAHYYYAVGVFQAYTGSSKRASTAGIPGHDECQAFPQCVELFVRRPTTSGQDIESSVLFNELTAAKERWASSFGMKSLHDQQQQRLFNAVQAVWAVEHKTFIDCILKETNEHLLQAQQDWLSTELFLNENIKSAACEDSKLVKKR